MFKLIFSLIIISLIFPIYGDEFFRINKLVGHMKFHWGFMDIKGNVKIPPKYEALGSMSDNVALAQMNDKWGIINQKGEFILKPQFDDVREFEDGLAWVIDQCKEWVVGECERGKWGLVDKTGKILIPPKYDGVMSEESPYINRIFGRMSGELFKEKIFFGKDGLAKVYIDAGDTFNRIRKYGVVNKEGIELIAPEYHKIGFFQNDVAPFAIHNRKGIYFGLIDIAGKIILEPTYRSIESLVSDEEVLWAASYYDSDEKRVLIQILDRDGKEVTSERFYQVKMFQNGLAYARKTHTSLWGRINRKGEWVLKPFLKSLTEITPQEERKKTSIEINGKQFFGNDTDKLLWFAETKKDNFDGQVRDYWGFADREGNIIYPANSFEKGNFVDGVSWVSLRYRKKNNGHIIYYALVDESGKELTEPIYMYVLPFRRGLGIAQVFGGHWGYINTKGKVVWWLK
ncbi:MAG TPA: WG repeat-containing protein [Leptospiraceae bacterium]|nr:WG repeat-containing protein [Leptospiraceae bacterium]